MDVSKLIADELSVSQQQVKAAVKLLDEGATVPFIARYRKEMTGGLDDTQLRRLEERLTYLRELDARRQTILKSINEQGKLTAELEQSINNADSKTLLEDLYLPYKPKRRTKAQIAREAGLEPLADLLLENRQLIPEQVAADYINPGNGITDTSAALDGARQIIMERISENIQLITELREYIWNNGVLCSKVAKEKETQGEKFKDYFEYEELIHKIPSHRALALLRGRNDDILVLSLKPSIDETMTHQYCIHQIEQTLNITEPRSACDEWLSRTASLAWKVKLFTKIEMDLKLRLREAAEKEAIHVFSKNLRDLLLAAPAGAISTMGLDPGIRTGVKVAVIDATGKLLNTTTIYPHPPKKQWDQSISVLADLIKQYDIKLISIGNGTGSRETDQLINDLLKLHDNIKVQKIMVSEAGASIYSASELAAKEFPDLDVSLRGAVSIARRIQDPLAELVKIEPKSIGVGQYQHDVNQVQLSKTLNSVVEDCVNAVGVDVNTASAALLKHVAGLKQSISESIVKYRNENGPFLRREDIKKVPRLGEKAYQQSAGFLRIINGKDPLDASAVHPEAYPVVNSILDDTGKQILELIGKSEYLRTLNPSNYTNEQFGLPTVTDILSELEKPGRDPRPEFKSVLYKQGIEKISDVQAGMLLEGAITNVTNFGAFVDIGVHQDGLVHISHLSDKFIKDPREVVKTGQIVTVRVIEVDVDRKRISLSMKSDSAASDANKNNSPNKQKRHVKNTQQHKPTTLASAFNIALNKK